MTVRNIASICNMVSTRAPLGAVLLLISLQPPREMMSAAEPLPFLALPYSTRCIRTHCWPRERTLLELCVPGSSAQTGLHPEVALRLCCCCCWQRGMAQSCTVSPVSGD